jgi:hypothetical protein
VVLRLRRLARPLTDFSARQSTYGCATLGSSGVVTRRQASYYTCHIRDSESGCRDECHRVEIEGVLACTVIGIGEHKEWSCVVGVRVMAALNSASSRTVTLRIPHSLRDDDNPGQELSPLAETAEYNTPGWYDYLLLIFSYSTPSFLYHWHPSAPRQSKIRMTYEIFLPLFFLSKSTARFPFPLAPQLSSVVELRR